MQRRSRSIGIAVGLLLVAGFVLPGGPSGVGASTAPASDQDAARLAGRWLAAQATDGAIDAAGTPDWGLSIDAAFADVAAGLDTEADVAIDRFATDVDAIIAPAGADHRIAGLLAKLLLLADADGRDPATFGGRDLRTELLAAQVTVAGPQFGRFRDAGPYGDSSNGFTQATAVLALARTGSVPANALAFLLAQRCPSGGVRLFFTNGGSCTDDARADVDTTALAIEALRAARDSGATGLDPAITATATWLAAQQHADGSFGGSGPTAASNANSTALAVVALRGVGATPAVTAALAQLRSLQLGCGATSVAADRWAVAYDATALAGAAGGIPTAGRDQFRRSTAQAVLALAPVSLVTLATGAAGSQGAEPIVDCVGVVASTSTTSTTPTSAPTSTSSTTSTTAPRATTTSTPSTTTTTIRTTTTVPSVTTTSSPATVSVRSATATRSSASSSGAGALAVTGIDPRRLVTLATCLAAAGAFVLLARDARRRD